MTSGELLCFLKRYILLFEGQEWTLVTCTLILLFFLKLKMIHFLLERFRSSEKLKNLLQWGILDQPSNLSTYSHSKILAISLWIRIYLCRIKTFFNNQWANVAPYQIQSLPFILSWGISSLEMSAFLGYLNDNSLPISLIPRLKADVTYIHTYALMHNSINHVFQSGLIRTRSSWLTSLD